MGFKEIECEDIDFIHLVQVTLQCRAFVSEILNVWVS
jgi:hypothetical protein